MEERKVLAEQIDFAQLVPSDFWEGIEVKTEVDLLKLGRYNIEVLGRYWKEQENDYERRLEEVQGLYGTLCGLKAEQLEQLAKEYECPEFPSVGFLTNDYPMPLDMASERRRAGATTWNFCGWCHYAVSPHDVVDLERKVGECKLESYCRFMSSKLLADSQQEEVTCQRINNFDTPCSLTFGGQEQLDDIVSALVAERNDILQQLNTANLYIGYLEEKACWAVKKPCFPGSRPWNWFRDGEKAVCLVHDLRGVPATVQAPFVAGLVTHAANGWHTSVWTKRQAHISDTQDCRSLSLPLSSPVYMHRWEFDYLRGDAEYRRLWLSAARREATPAQIEVIKTALGQVVLE